MYHHRTRPPILTRAAPHSNSRECNKSQRIYIMAISFRLYKEGSSMDGASSWITHLSSSQQSVNPNKLAALSLAGYPSRSRKAITLLCKESSLVVKVSSSCASSYLSLTDADCRSISRAPFYICSQMSRSYSDMPLTEKAWFVCRIKLIKLCFFCPPQICLPAFGTVSVDLYTASTRSPCARAIK